MGEFDVAIIGMAGRFPGARTLDQFWRNLRQGVASTTFYSERELIDAGFDPELVRDPNFVKAYPALDGVDMFDAGFFGYSPREAETIDPQQRQFLEVAWEALEDAGYDSMTYPGSIGIFGGASAAMYLSRRIAASGGSASPMEWLQLLVGSDKDYVATRAAYKLNLRGPSMSVQTACSTSLVAIHLACQSLINREADMALAGGVCIRLPQRTGYLYQPEGVLSPDGYCRSFDARGRGTVFGNGVGAVLLKRLEAALEDGDPIHAVIKGSAVNNDGATKIGFLAPSQEGQARAVSEALAVAQVEPRTVGYVECHGTATPVGDPIEIRALTEAFGGKAAGKGFCAIGSVKANVGHLDSAAGVAGVIRAVLALKHQELPPLAHFERPNPECDLEDGPFYVPRQAQPWVRGSTPRRAGVSAFAIGGTNAHVVLEEAPERPRVARPAFTARAAYLLPLSARGTGALSKLSAAYADRLGAADPEQLAAVSYTASVRRAHHAYRVAVVGSSAAQLRARLEAHARGETVRGVVVGERTAKSKVAFVFSGQGSQWVGMGRGLLAAEPVFREELERCDAAFRPHLGWSVREALHAEDLAERLERTEVLLPLLFSVQVAQVALLRSWGVEPDAVVGHSLGEAMAAHVAGMLTREDAARLVCLRTAAVASMVGKGGVALVELPREEVPPYLEGYAGRLAVAAENGPKNTLVAGEKEALAELLVRLEQRGIFCRRVRMGFASHSPQMEGPAAELRKKLAGLRPRPGDVRMLSTVTGEWVEDSELTAEYWGRNLREPVRFWSAVKRLAREGYGTLIEVSPHPVLTPLIEEALGALPTPATIWPTLRRGEDEPGAMLEVIGRLYASGHTVDFQQLYPSGGEVVPLPAYPWQHERFWLEDRVPGQDSASARRGSGHHPLLGELFEPAEAEQRYFQVDVGTADLPYLEDH
ncbi:type I polyketide synthase, partial [Hyalangium sp.]|uniref:type I polyketide synthase n=1 Tax=Hyalangium sp. TaxID=2028555 RepID=UPI002D52E70E